MTNLDPSAPVPDSPPALQTLVRPMIVVTVLTLATHVASVVVRIVMARLFGAGADLDAFFAAYALPQYLTAIIVGVLPQVCIPVIVSTARSNGIGDSRRVAQGITNVVLPAVLLLTAVCAVFSSALLRISAPGLAPAVHETATRLAWVLWLTVPASAAVSIATSIENAENRFFRATLVPLIGGMLNLALLIVLARPFGALGLAVATTTGVLVQMFLFGNLLTREGLRMRALASLPGTREAFMLLRPLLLSGIAVRLTIVAERYFGSRLPEGSISEISYANNIVGSVMLLLSIGASTVLFPKLSRHAAADDLAELGTTFSIAVRALWVLIAPAIAVGICLSRPAVRMLFEGGRFTAQDAEHVAALLQIYFLSLAASTLGMITGRMLYALKAARLLSIIGTMEGIAYVCYTALLVRYFGAAGVAWGFVIYVTISIVWHFIAITHMTRWTLFRATSWSAIRTTVAALIAALVARVVVAQFDVAWMQVLLGGCAAAAAFIAVLAIVNNSDLRLIVNAGRRA